IIFAVVVIGLIISDAIPFVDLKPMYHVSAPFQFVAGEKRTISAPFEMGHLEKVNFKAGQHFHKGDVLFEFQTEEIQAKINKAEHEAAGYKLTYNAKLPFARTDPKAMAEAQQALE